MKQAPLHLKQEDFGLIKLNKRTLNNLHTFMKQEHLEGQYDLAINMLIGTQERLREYERLLLKLEMED